MNMIAALTISVLVNIGLLWYVVRLLRKFMFISENIADLYFTAKAFQIFVKTLYSMDNYHGEPMIGELILRLREVGAEIEKFRETFQYTLDEGLEEELNAAEAAATETQVEVDEKPLFY